MWHVEATMKFEIRAQGTTVEISVHDVGRQQPQQPQLLQSLQECQSGSCGCPTDQYDRLAGMDLEAADGAVTLRLEPLPGQRVDPEQLRDCLEHTAQQ